MSYGQLLKRAWTTVWTHKYLILLGLLVALGSSGSSGSVSSGARSMPPSGEAWQLPQWDWHNAPVPWERGLPVLPMLAAILLVGLGLALALGLWVLSTLSRGALIAGAGAAEAGDESGFGEAFAAAWQRGWTLLGIGVVPAIPALLLLLVALGGVFAYRGLPAVVDGLDTLPGLRNVWALLGGLTCVALPVALVLGVLRTGANRACMIEGRGVFASYGRGFEVLLQHAGSALVLWLIQIGINLGLGLLLVLPALCCLLWPLLLVLQGLGAAFFSVAWTLAWRQWTGGEGLPEAKEV